MGPCHEKRVSKRARVTTIILFRGVWGEGSLLWVLVARYVRDHKVANRRKQPGAYGSAGRDLQILLQVWAEGFRFCV